MLSLLGSLSLQIIMNACSWISIDNGAYLPACQLSFFKVRRHTHKNDKIVLWDAMVNFDILPNLHSIVTLLSGLSDFIGIKYVFHAK